MRKGDKELTERAIKLWVEDNMPVIMEEDYIKPEPEELEEGGYTEKARNELSHASKKAAMEMWLKANSETIDELGLVVCQKGEYKKLLRKAKECEEVERENARLRSELTWMREQTAGLPTKKYRVLKPIGIFKKGLVIETFNIPWAEELIRQGFLEACPHEKTAKENGLVAVGQYCQSVGDVVTLWVKGKERGSLVDGDVEKCERGKCGMAFCWVGRHVLTLPTLADLESVKASSARGNSCPFQRLCNPR